MDRALAYCMDSIISVINSDFSIQAKSQYLLTTAIKSVLPTISKKNFAEQMTGGSS